MTQRSRWAFSRFARVATAVAAVVLFGAGRLLAQGETGKIEGTVKDSAGAPVGGAQVLIVGSAFHATTDDAGYFFMNNVPAGVVIVRAQQLGFAPNEVRNVHVLAGQTMTVNPVLSRRAIELTGITVTEEQNPIVPRDQVASKPIVEGQTIQDLPVDAVSQVLRLQPGVVEGSRGISIRGSRPGSQATYIDGVLVKNFNGGFGGGGGGSSSNTTSATTVGTNALEEASVTTGAVGASYGEAEGGVVNEVTRAGGTAYHGAISYATDNVSGQLYGSGLNRVEASLGGPIVSNFTFYLATTLQGQQNGLRPIGAGGIPQFVLGGAADSVMVPTQPSRGAFSDSQLVVVPHFVQYSSSGGCSYAAPSQPYGLGGDLTGINRTLSASEKGTCQSRPPGQFQQRPGRVRRQAAVHVRQRLAGVGDLSLGPQPGSERLPVVRSARADGHVEQLPGRDRQLVADAVVVQRARPVARGGAELAAGPVHLRDRGPELDGVAPGSVRLVQREQHPFPRELQQLPDHRPADPEPADRQLRRPRWSAFRTSSAPTSPAPAPTGSTRTA